MDTSEFLGMLDAACRSSQLYAVLIVIGVDWLFGCMRAIKNKEFQFRKMADFYRTMILPYGLGYFCLWIVCEYLPPVEGKLIELVPALGQIFTGENLQNVLLGILGLNLANSIFDNAKELGLLDLLKTLAKATLLSLKM